MGVPFTARSITSASMWLPYHAHLPNEVWNECVPSRNKAQHQDSLPRGGAGTVPCKKPVPTLPLGAVVAGVRNRVARHSEAPHASPWFCKKITIDGG
jgi:hypothetical protein